MKVAFLHGQCENGGISRIVFSITQLLEERGDSGMFFFSRGFVPEGKESVCHMFGSRAETMLHVLQTRTLDRHGLGSVRATRELIQALRDYQPDIIHLNNVHGYYLNYPLFFEQLKKMDIPVVWTLHDCWAFTGHCVHFEDVNCTLWKQGCRHCPQKKEYPASVLLDRSRQNYLQKKQVFTSLEKLTIVTPSRWLGDLVKASFLGSKDCRVIHNGINLDWFQPVDSDLRQRFSIGSRKIVLAAASVWTAKKGYDDMLKLAQMLDPAQYQIVMVGLNESQHRALSETSILPITHTKDVHELAQWYSAADLFVNPTYEDTFPTVNIESLACGTPVITYRTGGSPEVIAPGCGEIVPVGDVQAMADAARNLNKDSAVCRRRAEDFDCRQKFLDYIDLYRQILRND